jgi:hypothetical protein
MTGDELLALLQSWTPEQRKQQVFMEVDAGYAPVHEIDPDWRWCGHENDPLTMISPDIS